MSLKDMIRALMATRTTPLQASNAAMPRAQEISYGETTTSIGNWVRQLEFTAPTDGYAIATLTGTGSNQAALEGSGPIVTLNPHQAGAQMTGFIPVAKGQTVGVRSTTFNKITLSFVKTLGGG